MPRKPGVYGPYVAKSGGMVGRQYVTIVTEDGRRTSKLYSRWLMEQHLGRPLLRSEHVHHSNLDKTDDRLDNFELIAHGDHTRLHRQTGRTMVTVVCPQCGTTVEKEARIVKHNRRQGKAGPFCGRSCARAWQATHKPT